MKEKIGYGFGDMSSSMFWKIFSAYLPIFYATVFHLSLEVTGVLMLVTRIWDAVSDPMMGIIEKKANKGLIKLIFDKKHKELLIEEESTKMRVPDDYTEMSDYINSLSTNQWQYIGGRNLVDDATGLGESYVFYYDKQNVEVSKDGNKITAWIKYRYLDGKNPKVKPLVQYGLSQTTINFDDNTYVDHVMLTTTRMI